MEGWPSGQWQQTVNLPSQEFEGSNPSPSTKDCLSLVVLVYRKINDK